MKVYINTENCNFQSPYTILESTNSKIKISFEFQKIVSSQSRKVFVDNLKHAIHTELKKISWLICGKIQIHVDWLLDSVERQETDKIGDLDNITKPLIDSLSGKNGIFIDDCQINSLHMSWISKNSLNNDNLVTIYIDFSNDCVIYKHNLYFIQCENSIYTPVNLDIRNAVEILEIKTLLDVYTNNRKVAGNIKKGGSNGDRYLLYSEFYFHITRLKDFNPSQTLTIYQFNKICHDNNIPL